jgi:PKD repeat protein
LEWSNNNQIITGLSDTVTSLNTLSASGIYTVKVTDTLGCEPFCALFTNTTPKSSNAIWNFGDKPFEKQGNVTNYCYLNSGIYNVKLTINDSNNCKTSATYSSLINVLAKPIADFKTNPEVVTTNNLENKTLSAVSITSFLC